jgi:ABC-2 type transport system permease protein
MRSALAAVSAVIKTKFAEQTAYRSHFFLSVALLVAGDLIVPLTTLLVYRSGASFPGWTLYEALLIQAVFTLAKGIAFPLFFGMIGSTLGHVREGTFDLLLLKPRPALFMTVLTGVDPDDFGRLVSGVVLFGYVLGGIAAPSFIEWSVFVLLFGMSIVMMFSFSLIFSGILFRWVGSSRVFDIFDAVTGFGMYPGTIFSKTFQNLFTFVVPIGLMAFLPASALLGLMSPIMILASVVALFFLGGSLVFWHAMLAKYTSAGG